MTLERPVREEDIFFPVQNKAGESYFVNRGWYLSFFVFHYTLSDKRYTLSFEEFPSKAKGDK